MSVVAPEKKEILILPLGEIKWGTNNFDENNIIGSGGFGKVYKGKLAEYRGYGPVAVKRLDPNSHQGMNEYNTEKLILSRYRHPNIVSLIGYCEEGGEMILVYEYAAKGSLDKYLKPNTDKRDSLTWEMRLKICIGVASALECLHKGIGDHNVIHRDLKSGNILLDGNWVVDFGLAKEGPVNQIVSFVISGGAGTKVYIDPEYEETGILRMESDVYSFGVVLFELLCGRKANIPEYCVDERSLPKLAWRCITDGRIDEIVDPIIKSRTHWVSWSKLSGIAHRCIETKHKTRPKIAEIVAELQQALEFHGRRTITSKVRNQEKAPKENLVVSQNHLQNQQEGVNKEAPKKVQVISQNPLVGNQPDDRHTADKVSEVHEDPLQYDQVITLSPSVNRVISEKREKALDEDEVIITSSSKGAATHSLEPVIKEKQKEGDDMKLDDSTWEEKLPRDYEKIIKRSRSPVICTTKKQLFSILSEGIFLDGGNRFYWVNKDGKPCMMVPATEVLAKANSRFNGWEIMPEARFPKVGIISFAKSSEFQLEAVINIELLSFDIIYTAYVVYKLESINSDASASDLHLSCIPHDRRHSMDVVRSERTSDGWMEAKLWSFLIPSNENVATFKFQFRGYLSQGTGHIIFQGIEFRCKETNALQLKLPHKYEEVLVRSDSQIGYNMQSDVNLVLSRGIKIDNDRMFLWVNKNGETCLLMSAKHLQDKYRWIKPAHAHVNKWWQQSEAVESAHKWISLRESRFSQVMELYELKQILLDAGIDIELLSPKTRYNVFLVFKYKHVVVPADRGYFKYDDATATRKVRISEREDGWIEAKIGNFIKETDGQQPHLFVHATQTWTSLVEGLEFRADDEVFRL